MVGFFNNINKKKKLPTDIFIERFNTLDKHVLEEYPHVWIDTYLFFTAICFVIATAAFSIVARAADLSMWYPLIMLLIPTVIGFITTRRRNKYYKKLAAVIYKILHPKIYIYLSKFFVCSTTNHYNQY